MPEGARSKKVKLAEQNFLILEFKSSEMPRNVTHHRTETDCSTSGFELVSRETCKQVKIFC